MKVPKVPEISKSVKEDECTEKRPVESMLATSPYSANLSITLCTVSVAEKVIVVRTFPASDVVDRMKLYPIGGIDIREVRDILILEDLGVDTGERLVHCVLLAVSDKVVNNELGECI